MGSHAIAGGAGSDIRMTLDAIRRIVRWLRVASRASERSVGLTAAQMFVLSRLDSPGPAPSMNELAARTLTHQSSVSVVVSRLERAGFVQRARSERDGRRQELSLTARGRAVLRDAPDSAQDRLIRALRKMPASDRARLSDLLGRFVELAGIQEPADMFFEESVPSKRARNARTRR
jgi:DNA-binding MarR family transcriptional regulator